MLSAIEVSSRRRQTCLLLVTIEAIHPRTVSGILSCDYPIFERAVCQSKRGCRRLLRQGPNAGRLPHSPFTPFNLLCLLSFCGLRFLRLSNIGISGRGAGGVRRKRDTLAGSTDIRKARRALLHVLGAALGDQVERLSRGQFADSNRSGRGQKWFLHRPMLNYQCKLLDNNWHIFDIKPAQQETRKQEEGIGCQGKSVNNLRDTSQ